MVVRELRKEDVRQAMQFAAVGMHFEWYLKNRFLRNLYSRYFWYLENNRATQRIAAYDGDVLAGVLLAEIHGEPKKYFSERQTKFVAKAEWIQKTFFKDSAGQYDDVNHELFAQYAKTNAPDGEILFLAANPEAKNKGVGTLLLNELAKREKGKKIFLYTDDACTYQFYEHRGFDRACEKKIELDFGDRKVLLNCFLFSKIL